MIPGDNTSIMEPFFWAYSVAADGSAVWVRCRTADEAREEHGRLRMSAAKIIGHVTRRIPEADVWKYSKAQGWKLKGVRWFKATVGVGR